MAGLEVQRILRASLKIGSIVTFDIMNVGLRLDTRLGRRRT